MKKIFMYSMLPVTAIYESARHNNILKFTRDRPAGLVGAAGSCVTNVLN